jgi:LmbE family N-acetylglucosaminyl deacetylase
MLRLSLDGAARRVLAIGCHADDIEIGAGGTLLSLVAATPELEVTWVVLAASGPRAEEARRSAEAFAGGARSLRVIVESFRDGFLPYVGHEVKEFFERLKLEVDPDLVLTHTSDDLHQDHRLACELTWNTFRDHLILEYEVPKYDGDLGSPNLFVPLAESVAHAKVQHLLEAFASQRQKHWFTEDLFLGLMRLRGMETGGATHYAEGFYLRKAVWGAPAR